MEIELVVFDMAGTTVYDPGAVNACFRAALLDFGATPSEEAVNQVMGLPKKEAIQRLVAGSPLTDRIDAIHDNFVRRMIAFYQTDPSVCEMPGTEEAFIRLQKAGVRVAVNSGFSRAIVAVLLDRLGWKRTQLVQASVSSDEVPRGRPHPDMIARLMAQFAIPSARRVAKVGDTPVDLEEGTRAGCGFVIGVTNGTHTRSQLAEWPHTHLVDSVAEVPAVLGIP